MTILNHSVTMFQVSASKTRRWKNTITLSMSGFAGPQLRTRKIARKTWEITSITTSMSRLTWITPTSRYHSGMIGAQFSLSLSPFFTLTTLIHDRVTGWITSCVFNLIAIIFTAPLWWRQYSSCGRCTGPTETRACQTANHSIVLV